MSPFKNIEHFPKVLSALESSMGIVLSGPTEEACYTVHRALREIDRIRHLMRSECEAARIARGIKTPKKRALKPTNPNRDTKPPIKGHVFRRRAKT